LYFTNMPLRIAYGTYTQELLLTHTQLFNLQIIQPHMNHAAL